MFFYFKKEKLQRFCNTTASASAESLQMHPNLYCFPSQLMTPLMISTEVVAVTRGVQAKAGWGDRCLVLGASQRSGLVSQGLIQVCTSQQITPHILDSS